MRRLLSLGSLLTVSLAVPGSAQATPPLIAPNCIGFVSCDRWFTTDVHLRWTITGGAPTAGCQELVLKEDTPPTGRRFDCAAQQTEHPYDPASAAVTIFRDATPPVITDATPDRPPDHAGWYTRPVTFSISGSDVTSGLHSCDKVTYGGPDNGAAAIVATCRDAVGHVATRAFPLRYDATPPDPSGATAETGDRLVRLRWPAAASASISRTPGVNGESSTLLAPAADGITDVRVTNGVTYRYLLTIADEAGNAASRELVVTPGAQLLQPVKRALLAAPPVLRWTPVRGARYYNVQLFRGGRKILSAWPRRPELRLKEKWRFRGRRYRLIDGKYRWYVWPGKGPISARRYGPRIGARSFVLDRHADVAGRR
jgi:hypothetical protein